MNFCCFSPNRFSHFHCNAMRKVIKHTNQQNEHIPAVLWIALSSERIKFWFVLFWKILTSGESMPPPPPNQLKSHKKDGRQRQSHRFHVNWTLPYNSATASAIVNRFCLTGDCAFTPSTRKTYHPQFLDSKSWIVLFWKCSNWWRMHASPPPLPTS